MCTPLLIVWLHQRYGWVRRIGTVIMAYAIGILLSVTGITPAHPSESLAQIQTLLMNVSVPLAIPLMLFGCDFRLWTRSLPKTFQALLGGLLAVLLSVVSAYFIFRNRGICGDADRFADITAMLSGIYTGGTMNFNALGLALHVDETVLTTLLTIEMLVTFPYLAFVAAGGFRIFHRLLPFGTDATNHEQADVEMHDVEEYGGMTDRKTLPRTMVGLLLSVLFLLCGISLSLLLTGALNELIIILTITTLSIGAGFSRKIRALPKTFELGMILILLFSVVVASRFDFRSLSESMLPLAGFVLYVLMMTIMLHVLMCRLMHVEGDLFVVANIGLLCSPPFIPPVVGAMGNKCVLISGIAIGLAGYAIGTYLGVGITYLLHIIG
ncbi:MAG: DUF819 family protein [Paludibacteraceae bacterium]|nr:DUF819 family protein [Paludibacteraceae bacterium]